MSRNVSTCRSGMTSRCVSARGLMSATATKPSPCGRGRPPRRACRRDSQTAPTIPSSVTAAARTRHELADRSRAADEPRRVVVPVPAPGTVDEHLVRRAELRAPAVEASLVRVGAQLGAAALLHRWRHGILGGGRRPGPRRVREDVHLRDPASRATRRVRSNACSSSVGKADDDVGRQVEVRERRESAQVGRGRVAAAHRAQHPVVARLERHVQVPARRSASRAAPARARRSTWLTSIDERRRRCSPGVAPASRTSRAQRVAALTVAEAAEVDPREHDLAMALLDAPADLAAAPRRRSRLREAPRTSGITQKLHEKLQPSCTRTKARTRSSRASAWTQPIAPTSPATNAGVSSLRRETTATFSGSPANASPARFAPHSR